MICVVGDEESSGELEAIISIKEAEEVIIKLLFPRMAIFQEHWLTNVFEFWKGVVKAGGILV